MGLVLEVSMLALNVFFCYYDLQSGASAGIILCDGIFTGIWIGIVTSSLVSKYLGRKYE